MAEICQFCKKVLKNREVHNHNGVGYLGIDENDPLMRIDRLNNMVQALRGTNKELEAELAHEKRKVKVLAGHDDRCPPFGEVKCRRIIDTESDTFESCIACKIEWAYAKAKKEAK